MSIYKLFNPIKPGHILGRVRQLFGIEDKTMEGINISRPLRRELKACHTAIAAANAERDTIAARLESLNTTVATAQKADSDLHTALATDADALAAYASGGTPSAVGNLVEKSDRANRAAAAARSALPAAEVALASAETRINGLDADLNSIVAQILTEIADDHGLRYSKMLDDLTQMAGNMQSLVINIGGIDRNTPMEPMHYRIEAPSFNIATLRTEVAQFTPLVTRQVTDNTMAQYHDAWRRIINRLRGEGI